MKGYLRLLPLLAASVLFVAFRPVSAGSELKVATWNMAWLTDRQAGDPGLPSNVVPRKPADFLLVKKYVSRVNADVLAFQEVDGAKNAARAIDTTKYELHLTDETDTQRPGFAVRKTIKFVRNPDFVELDVRAHETRSVRRGADITVEVDGHKIRMLAVHLKASCSDGSITPPHNNDCQILSEQLPILKKWISARKSEGIPFILLGDFNRRFSPREPFWKGMIQAGDGLLRVTDGIKSKCWGGSHPDFIDHIILSGKTKPWLKPKSVVVTVFDETAPSFKNRISDHCPLQATLRVP